MKSKERNIMKNESSIKKTKLFAIAVLISVSLISIRMNAWSTANSGWTTIQKVFMNDAGSFGMRLASGAKCGGNSYWGFDATTPQGNAMMSSLLAAYLSGKQVLVTCTGLYGSWDNVKYFYVQ